MLFSAFVVAFISLVFFVALANAVAPTVSVEDAGDVSYTSAHAKGTVDPQGQETSCHFEFISQGQLDENLGNGFGEWEGAGQAGCNVEPLTGSGAQAVEAQLEGLAPSTVYHLRLVASNADGQSEAVAASTFETEAVSPASATIDPVTDVTGTTAHFSGSINPQAPAGNPAAFDVNWHFECSPECPDLAGGTVSADSSDHTVEADASGLEPNTAYEVKLVASNAGGPAESASAPFTTEAIAPSAETVPAFALEGGTVALLGVRIDPQNSATTYRIEYGPTTSYGQTVSGDAGSGSSNQVFSQEAGGLSPSTTYHFRAVAENATGETAGRDMTFETAPAGPAIQQNCPNAQLREENRSSELPDCRAYEMVSPPDKNGNDAAAGDLRAHIAAADGDSVSFETFGALPGSQSATALNQNLSRRTNSGWVTLPISPPQKPAPLPDQVFFTFFSPDLDKAVVAMRGATVSGADPDSLNLYLRDNTDDTYTRLSVGSPGDTDVTRYDFAGASADMERIVFESADPLTPDSPPGFNLYEWFEGQVRLAGVLPNDEPTAVFPLGGTKVLSIDNLVSDDGSRIVFQTPNEAPGGSQIYLRENGERTVQVSASERDVPDPTGGSVRFWGASADGSQIFFTSSKALTNDAKIGDVALYRYDVAGDFLENLTVSPSRVDVSGADDKGVVGISENGSHVYFATDSTVVPGEGDDGEPHIYLRHDGDVRLVATSSPGSVNENSKFARVTADGRYLVFQSERQLTSYDNTDAVTGERVVEVYLYDAVEDRMVCASCKPSGTRPKGPARLPGSPTNAPRNKPRSVSDDGRVFFDSSDALVADDGNGRRDVYAYQGGHLTLISPGSGSDNANFVDASSDGADVFFVTRQQLVAADRDENLDVYDARVGGGFPQPAGTDRACEGDECQGQARPAPAATIPGSAAISPHPKPSLRKHKLARALRACRSKHLAKQRRRHCERKAKQRFGGSNSRGEK
jgi:hypothetical protein